MAKTEAQGCALIEAIKPSKLARFTRPKFTILTNRFFLMVEVIHKRLALSVLLN